jgi:hypothetical protein
MSGLRYNGSNLPPGGVEGEVLIKVSNADYYVQYKSLTEVFTEYDFEIDEGEY